MKKVWKVHDNYDHSNQKGALFFSFVQRGRDEGIFGCVGHEFQL